MIKLSKKCIHFIPYLKYVSCVANTRRTWGVICCFLGCALAEERGLSHRDSQCSRQGSLMVASSDVHKSHLKKIHLDSLLCKADLSLWVSLEVRCDSILYLCICVYMYICCYTSYMIYNLLLQTRRWKYLEKVHIKIRKTIVITLWSWIVLLQKMWICHFLVDCENWRNFTILSWIVWVFRTWFQRFTLSISCITSLD